MHSLIHGNCGGSVTYHWPYHYYQAAGKRALIFCCYLSIYPRDDERAPPKVSLTNRSDIWPIFLLNFAGYENSKFWGDFWSASLCCEFQECRTNFVKQQCFTWFTNLDACSVHSTCSSIFLHVNISSKLASLWPIIIHHQVCPVYYCYCPDLGLPSPNPSCVNSSSASLVLKDSIL